MYKHNSYPLCVRLSVLKKRLLPLHYWRIQNSTIAEICMKTRKIRITFMHKSFSFYKHYWFHTLRVKITTDKTSCTFLINEFDHLRGAALALPVLLSSNSLFIKDTVPALIAPSFVNALYSKTLQQVHDAYIQFL